MELNMTLVVQAINFLCAYFIMRYGLFTYAIACAKEDKEYITSLMSAIMDRTVIIEQKVLEKNEHWKACQQQLAKHEPSPRLIQEVQAISTLPVLQIPDISDETVSQTIKYSVEEIRKIGDLP